MVTLRELIDERISKLNPLATVYIAVFQFVLRAVVTEEGPIYVPSGLSDEPLTKVV